MLLMKVALEVYGISDNAVERRVKETPLAHLASVLIRRERPEGDESGIDDDLFNKYAQTIHERNLLTERQRLKLVVVE